jgi:hypothetical protein
MQNKNIVSSRVRISKSSFLGKVFIGILNNRLASLSDEIGLLSSAQAGFRNSHSTTDNIFIF